MLTRIREILTGKRPHAVRVIAIGVDEWMWNERGANGEITCTSHPETFTRREDAERAARDHITSKKVLA